MDWIFDIFMQTDLLLAFLLLGMGCLAYVISTVSGGGGALLLVPLLNFTIGTAATAPALNLGNLIGRPARLIIFWRYIEWKVVLYYAPFAIGSAWLAGWIFSEINIEWLQLIIGLFLISTLWQYRFGRRARSFAMRYNYFIPLGILISLLGTLIGALGPVLNPFYLNAGLDKEKLIATKTANSFFMGLSQIGSYTFFGLLEGELWIYGICIGLGATIGNIIGKRLLGGMSSRQFRYALIALMVISGVLMIGRILSQIMS